MLALLLALFRYFKCGLGILGVCCLSILGPRCCLGILGVLHRFEGFRHSRLV